MATISWGQCSLLLGKYPSSTTGGYDITKLGTGMVKMATPVNNSTTINIDEGEKHEAEIEGGGNEAVRYDEDKYSLECDIRRAAGRPVIGTGNGKLGQQDGVFALILQAENAEAPSIVIEAANVKRGISFTSSDGIYDHYTFDALVPLDGNAVKLGVVSAIVKADPDAPKKETVVTPASVKNAEENSKCEVTFDGSFIGYEGIR